MKNIFLLTLYCVISIQTYAQEVYTEMPFIIEDGVVKCQRVVVSFNKNVIHTTSGVTIVDTSIFPIKDENVKNILKELSFKYGYPIIRKTIPRLVWGDTLVTNKRTGEILKVPDMSQNFRLDFPIPVPLDSVLYIFNELPAVKYAEQPVSITPSYTPSDPYFSSQWNLSKINALQAWDITKGSSNIRVAVIDVGYVSTPFDISNHEDFQLQSGGNKFVGGSLYNSSNHARWVAGIIGATTNNNTGIASLGWNTSLLAYHFVSGTAGTNLANLIDQAVNPLQGNADIINFSLTTLGMCDGELCPRDFQNVSEAVIRAYNYGVVMVAAAGNGEYQGCNPIDCNGGLPFKSCPAAYSRVIAVTATNPIDNFAEYWNYGSWVDVAAPGSGGIYTLHVGYNNYITVDGTSFSSPQVSALAALILSINQSLTPSEIKSIIEQSADKVGQDPYLNGRNNYLGYGRINAYQAVLLALAYSNKSANYDATFSNNSHIIERGYFGKLYEVFHSGGEIFYRRSSNNGTSWEITKRITSGNGSNNNPSIVAGVGSTDVLRLVWQRKLDNTHYEIWYSYSTNSGTDWSAPAIVPGCSNVTVSYYQSNPGAGPGPTPVVASFWRGGAEGMPSFLLVYSDQNGLRYRYANDNNLSWTIPANDIVPGSNLSSIVWYPCLASYNSQGYNVNLIYDDRFAHVYSQIYNEDGTWTNRVIADGVGTYNRMSSVALDYTNNTLGVWSGWNGSNYVIRFRQGFANGTWSSWSKEWSVSGVNSFCPVATYYNKGGAYPYGIDILWYTTSNQIRQKKYYGLDDNWIPADPNTQLLYSNGLFPNITHERQNTTIPKQIHTDQTIQPYSLIDNSLNLPKENLIVGGANYRAAEITDSSTNSNFRIELKEPILTLMTGDKIVLPFKEYNYQDTLTLSTENVFTYLQTKLSNIPNTAQSITFKINIVASQPDTNSRGILNTNKATPFKNVVFKLLAKDNSLNTLLNNIGYVTLNNSSGIYQHSKEFTINIQALRNKNIFIIPNVSISGSFNQNNLFFSLVNISVEENSIAKDSTEIVLSEFKPSEYILEQNYPNPFNPVTQIKYSIVDNGIVSLKIYDVLGREIATLVNEEKATGNYEVRFDASQLSSGIYLYTLSTTGGVGSFTQTRKMVLLK
jgi:thermitase